MFTHLEEKPDLRAPSSAQQLAANSPGLWGRSQFSVRLHTSHFSRWLKLAAFLLTSSERAADTLSYLNTCPVHKKHEDDNSKRPNDIMVSFNKQNYALFGLFKGPRVERALV